MTGPAQAGMAADATPAVAPAAALLSVRGLHAGYGQSRVLRGVDFDAARGQVTAILGRNGAGRSTLLKALMGLLPVTGAILFKGHDVAGWPPHRVARAGMGYVAESRDIFPRLSVRENLQLGVKHPASAGAVRRNFDAMWELFPLLHERAGVAGGALSGGEQQMLAMARALMGDPELLLVDEPTEGLAPAMVHTVAGLLANVAARGVAVLLVEQKFAMAEAVSSRVLLLGQGCVQFAGTPAQLRERGDLRSQWLEV